MEEINGVIEELQSKMDKIGLYLVNVNIGTSKELSEDESPDIKKLLQSGEAQFAIIATFTIGDVAFTDRVVEPEKHELDTEFAKTLPSEADILMERFSEAASSGSIFDALANDLDEDDLDDDW